MNNDGNVKGFLIGQIIASIGGDLRFASKVEVHYDNGDVIVTLSETVPSGGMDGSSYANRYRVTKVKEVKNASGAMVVDAVWDTIDSTIKDYGTPRKKFMWFMPCSPEVLRGVSIAKVNKVLKALKAIDSE